TEQLQAILDGELDTAPGSIDMRSNNREYYSRGVQFGLNWDGVIGAVQHNIEVGLRLHEDEEDRLQFDSSYQQVNGTLVFNDTGALGAAGNRRAQAEALALHIYDRIESGNWVITPGLRYEDIELTRLDYSGGADRALSGTRGNDVQVWLPGLGVSYLLSDRLTLIGGVHKGFTAPTNAPGVDEEEALNYELGLRFSDSNLNLEAIGFLSDYENLLGVCTASSGSNCAIGDAFNGDAATVAGLEFMLSTDLSTTAAYSVPVQLTYTYINGEFDTDIGDTSFFGDVSAGDPIPYIPENQFRLGIGLEAIQWGLNLSANYVGQVCVRASCGAFEQTDDALILDMSAHYQLNDSMRFFGRLENLSGEENIMGRQPYGARPNKARMASVGVRMRF
ncbi:MAG: TonB-dependent receptor, partial [Pseudohongiellaceae bacterium]